MSVSVYGGFVFMCDVCKMAVCGVCVYVCVVVWVCECVCMGVCMCAWVCG